MVFEIRNLSSYLALIAVFASIVGSEGAYAGAANGLVTYLARFPHFNPSFDTSAPGDVDVSLERSLSKQGQFSRVQREFELYAWQLFIAVNGAADTDPTAVSSRRIARWRSWTTTHELSDAAAQANGKARLCPEDGHSALLNGAMAQDAPRVLVSISTLSPATLPVAEASTSVFSTPLVDQHGEFVFYESLLDPNQIAFMCKNDLLSAAGSSRLAHSPSGISFPSGSESVDWSGSFSLKLAWKILDPAKGDLPARYIVSSARVLDIGSDGHPVWRQVEVGLVGMHLVHKSESAPERIWATFEQVDNLGIDDVKTPGVRPSFYDPLCSQCPVNQPSRPTAARQPTQVARAVPICFATEDLNREAQAALAARGSVLQYYKLVGVEWPGVAGDATSATPPYLANAVMETFIQPLMGSPDPRTASNGSIPAEVIGASCISCHAEAPSTAHSSRALRHGEDRADGDFAWFLSKRLP